LKLKKPLSYYFSGAFLLRATELLPNFNEFQKKSYSAFLQISLFLNQVDLFNNLELTEIITSPIKGSEQVTKCMFCDFEAEKNG